MKRRTLARLCSLRALQEEQTRLNLAHEAAKLKQIQRAQDLVDRTTREHRDQVNVSFARGDRSLALPFECYLEMAPGRQRRLEAMKIECKARVEALENQYLEKRKRRLQVEVIHNAEQARRLSEGLRKEQNALDEWFLGRPPAGRFGMPASKISQT